MTLCTPQVHLFCEIILISQFWPPLLLAPALKLQALPPVQVILVIQAQAQKTLNPRVSIIFF